MLKGRHAAEVKLRQGGSMAAALWLPTLPCLTTLPTPSLTVAPTSIQRAPTHPIQPQAPTRACLRPAAKTARS